MDRVTQMIDASGTTAYTYHLNRRLQSENGPWANDTVTYGYHTQSPFLRTSLTLQQPAGSWTQSYAYDAARRLDTLTSPAGQFAYDYHLAGRKVENLFLPTGGRIANDYATDPLARLTGTWLLNSAQQTLNYHGYEHNLRNDITRHTRTDASFVDYDYDNLGQLTDAVGSGGQSVELLAYGYDTGWNMTGNGATGYFVNDRNQVTGMTDGTNLGYDAHGNLIGRDNWNQQYGLIYTYDAENRLTRVEEDTYYIPYYAMRSDFVYDGLSRLRIRKEYLYTSGWALTGETRYLYDGRRVIQERSSANTPTVSYTRGNDLSGSLEGAGGIGGMLARSHGYSGSTGNWSTHNYYHADAGGNITCLINAGQSITASYRYDPFGRTLFQSGTMANANVYRFSSKEVHGFTGMYYYGFRFYDPGLQRWINRDPIGERYDRNLYRFGYNSPLKYIDPDGLTGWQLPPQLHQDPEFTQGFYQGAGSAFAAGCLIAAALSPIPGDEAALAAALLGRAGNAGVNAIRTAKAAKAAYPRVKVSKGTRADVWERSKSPDGKVYDPSGREIKPGEPWELGHKPGHKLSDAQKRAADECWDADTWKRYQRNPDIYRPELPRTNAGHQHEIDW